MKCKFLLLAICVVLCPLQLLSNELAYLTVELKTGSRYSFLLDDYPEITFSESSLIINEEASTSYEIKNVRYYYFSASDQTGLEENASDLFRIIPLGDNRLRIEGLSGRCAKVIDVGGRILSSVNGNEGCAEVSLPAQRGVYILTDGSHTVKIIQK